MLTALELVFRSHNPEYEHSDVENRGRSWLREWVRDQETVQTDNVCEWLWDHRCCSVHFKSQATSQLAWLMEMKPSYAYFKVQLAKKPCLVEPSGALPFTKRTCWSSCCLIFSPEWKTCAPGARWSIIYPPIRSIFGYKCSLYVGMPTDCTSPPARDTVYTPNWRVSWWREWGLIL